MKKLKISIFSNTILGTFSLFLMIACNFDQDPLRNYSDLVKDGRTDYESKNLTPTYTNSVVRLQIVTEEPAVVFDLLRADRSYSLGVEVIGASINDYEIDPTKAEIELVEGPRYLSFDKKTKSLSSTPAELSGTIPSHIMEVAKFNVRVTEGNNIFETINHLPIYFLGKEKGLLPSIILAETDSQVTATDLEDTINLGTKESHLKIHVFSFEYDDENQKYIPPSLTVSKVTGKFTEVFKNYELLDPIPGEITDVGQYFTFNLKINPIHLFETTDQNDQLDLKVHALTSKGVLSNELLLHATVSDFRPPDIILPFSSYLQPLTFEGNIHVVYSVSWRGEVLDNQLEMGAESCQGATEFADTLSSNDFTNTCFNQNHAASCSLEIPVPDEINTDTLYCIDLSATLESKTGLKITGKNAIFFQWKKTLRSSQ